MLYSIMEKFPDGALVGLQAYGHQDRWMKKNKGLFDMHNVLINERYQVVYRKLSYRTESIPKSNCWGQRIKVCIQRTCDLINNLDLMIKNPNNIKSIEVSYGGQRFDKVYSFEQLKTLAVIFKRDITVHDDAGVGIYAIPLCMAPFHSNNLVFPSVEHHELQIYIEFHDSYDDLLEIYGDMYFLETEDRKRLATVQHEFATIQSQYCGPEKIQKGTNCVRVNFNHPVYMIYFYGLDKSKINNIKLSFDTAVYYDGPVYPLEHRKLVCGFGQVEPLMIMFSTDEFNKVTRSTINFSRIDNAVLEIDTDESDTEVHVVGLNCQGVRYMNGMYGLVYSK